MLRLDSPTTAGQALSTVRNAGVPQPSSTIICAVVYHVLLAGGASTVLFPCMSALGKHELCAVFGCLCTYVADTAVDATCRQQAVNVGSTVVACMAGTLLLQLLHLSHLGRMLKLLLYFVMLLLRP